ncbi:MAG: hypothetical protein DRJ31_09585 [Candidatus Methanomethylicota archaeon]|uniref:Uncharacterized protein n=1 Tax=Thermoproteota archaeon TaxID=2056631 RepID=A0A497EK54_9CREN|nr:MAG: hypothetical protein DRJ31_09585 [Candidatus Verstraetearchaeota archaeon]
MSVEVSKDACMKVSFQYDPRIMDIFKGLPPVFKIERRNDEVTVYCPLGYEIRRDFHGFKVREFKEIFRKLNVENGRKLWRSDHIILEPKKTAYLPIRISPSELELLKKAAERAGETLSDYVRAAAMTRMVRELGL